MSLTSCEGALDDILGEWSRPTPGSSTGGAVAVTGIDLDADEMKLAAGDKGQLTAKVDPAGTAVTWSSDKEEIATVDANGLVTAVAVGTAIITAKAGDKTATCEVTVTPGLSTPLTIEAITAGTITVTNPKSNMKFSKNGAAKANVGITSISVAAGDKVAFYGTDPCYGSTSPGSCTMIGGDGDDFKCKVYGNIMSLVDETGFAKNTTLTANETFLELFDGNAKLTDASGLLLPAMTLKVACYAGMFDNCTNLAAAPKELPAQELTAHCYSTMFIGCSQLTETPKLPATTLADQCYQGMFSGCTSLSSVTCLATDISATNCTDAWLSGVAASGTFTTPNTTVWGTGSSKIPSGWTRKNPDGTDYVAP